jgi:hypothetical protein
LPTVSKDSPGSAALAAMVRDARALPALLTMRPKESQSLYWSGVPPSHASAPRAAAAAVENEACSR